MRGPLFDALAMGSSDYVRSDRVAGAVAAPATSRKTSPQA
jgi:hypothetical protein